MTEKTTCPCCGSEDIIVKGHYDIEKPCHCFDCPCEWDESKRQLPTNWIPCAEELPEINKLGRINELYYPGIVTMAFINKNGCWRNYPEDWWEEDIRNVEYWQPLPSPPAGKDGA